MLGAVLYWLGCIDTYRDYDISPAWRYANYLSRTMRTRNTQCLQMEKIAPHRSLLNLNYR
jgi:hypothetical protein